MVLLPSCCERLLMYWNRVSFISAGLRIAVSVICTVCVLFDRLKARSGNEKSDAPMLSALLRE